MPANYQRSYIKRLRKRQGLNPLQEQFQGMQDVSLLAGEESVVYVPKASLEAISDGSDRPEIHLKPGTEILRAIHQVAEAAQKNPRLD